MCHLFSVWTLTDTRAYQEIDAGVCDRWRYKHYFYDYHGRCRTIWHRSAGQAGLLEVSPVRARPGTLVAWATRDVCFLTENREEETELSISTLLSGPSYQACESPLPMGTTEKVGQEPRSPPHGGQVSFHTRTDSSMKGRTPPALCSANVALNKVRDKQRS